MKRIVRYIMITGLIAVLSAPVMEGRDNRRGRGENSGRTEQTHNRGQHNPGQRPTSPANGNRRPANNPQRPGGNNNGNKHPGNNHNNRPMPKPAPKPGPRPHPGNHGHSRPLPPPRHDHWPSFHRPTPPPHYVYRGHGPTFGSILGMMLGTAFNVSLSYLNNHGYNVSGYGNNTIYINNVSQMNFNWPDAVLYYNNGLLSSSQYISSTTWHDTSRYNMLYNSFSRQYGYPVSVNNSGMNMSASWFGNDGRFVTIQYSPGYTSNGAGCYYTTLSFGN